MMHSYSLTVNKSLYIVVLVMLFPLNLIAEQPFTLAISNSEIDSLLTPNKEPNLNLNKGLSVTGSLRSTYKPGIYQLNIDSIDVGWKGVTVMSDLNLIFSFRYNNDESKQTANSDGAGKSIGSTVTDQMNKEYGIFFMSIGKSW